MKKQLSTLQELISVMDPELYRHFGLWFFRFVYLTFSLFIDRENRGPQFVFLFPVSIKSRSNASSDVSCSWVLIAFKREFPFHDVLRLWEVLWTDYYSNNFVLFVALAILESHRDMILRYLVEVRSYSLINHYPNLTMCTLSSSMRS